MRLHALTIFLGAFLLFQVQPLIARFILPWYGGTAAAWATCMLFFQVFLLLGYAYAHASVRYLTPHQQTILHGILLLISLAFLPIVPGADWAPTAADEPVTRILLLLTACLGLPYLILAATGPLLQAWFHRAYPDTSPYRLFALSNAGSLLALLSYPFLIAPAFSRQDQATLWAWSFGLFALLCASCAWRNGREAAESDAPIEANLGPDSRPSGYARAMWFLLATCGSLLLLATTNKLCQDVASIPFLWVLPLSIYLISFIICFDHPKWYARRAFTTLLIPMVALLAYALLRESSVSILEQILIYCGSLFVTCMVCHGEVHRLRPAPRHLTAFYLLVAAGGATGGLLVAIAAPLLLHSYTELHWGLALLALLLVLIHWRERTGITIEGRFRSLWPITAGGAFILAMSLFAVFRKTHDDTVYATRGFYGALRIEEVMKDDLLFHAYKLMHGHINHGLQFVDPPRARMPTTYFHELSGVGLAIKHLPDTPRHIGVIGLGVGTLATYTRAEDIMRFYEINPQVVEIARQHFQYLNQASGQVEIVMGDGRLSLEREPAQRFDLLVLDAFTGDAIPVHLLTREAFATYLRHLKPDGVIAMQITNRHVNILPVALDLAAHYNLHLADIRSQDGLALWWYSSSRWVLMSRNERLMKTDDIKRATRQPSPKLKPLTWTDEHSSLLPVIRW